MILELDRRFSREDKDTVICQINKCSSEKVVMETNVLPTAPLSRVEVDKVANIGELLFQYSKNKPTATIEI